MATTVYVVMRDDHRVSEREYIDSHDTRDEVRYWEELLRRFPDGSKITVKERKLR
jgi:hypothetical protein